MTEFEAASLLATYVQAGVALLVGLVQCALIAYGLKLMRQSTRHRDQQHEETMLALQQQGEGLRALIERTAQR